MKKNLVSLTQSQLEFVKGGELVSSSDPVDSACDKTRNVTKDDAYKVADYLGRDHYSLLTSMSISSLEIQKFIDASLKLKYTLQEARKMLYLLGIGIRL